MTHSLTPHLLRRLAGFLASLRAAWRLRPDAVAIEKEIALSGFFRESGHWYKHDIEQFAQLVKNVPGAFCEVGVRHGYNFRNLVPLALAQGKAIYAVDSFEGTKQTCEFDGRPDFDMSIGGVDVFHDHMNLWGFCRNDYQTLVGWIPDVFSQFPDDVRFSFIVLDVDNYTPTVDSIRYLWPRIAQGGLLLFDDFFTEHEIDAGRAIREFLRDQSDYWIERVLPNRQIVVRKQ